jgi:hypothetical protein
VEKNGSKTIIKEACHNFSKRRRQESRIIQEWQRWTVGTEKKTVKRKDTLHVGKSQWISLSLLNISWFLSYYINTPLALFFSNNKPNQESQTKKTRPFSSLILSFVFFFCPTLLGFQVLYSLSFFILGDAFKLSCFISYQFLGTCCQFVCLLCC